MLKTKTVGIYTVSQFGPLEGARMRLHQRNIAAQKVTDEAITEVLSEWAMVASCVTPFIPQADYLQMPITETGPLVEAAAEMNADMLGVVSTDTPAQAKKKRVPRT
jgi:hypothetical protein